MHKKLLLFGVFWFLISGLYFYTLNVSDTVRMNGKVIPDERRQTLLLPTGAAALAGAGLVIYSGKQVLQERHTEKYGAETYGIITEITTLSFKINHAEQKKARVLVLSEGGTIMDMSKYIGENDAGYHAADFVRVKYLDNHVNLLRRIGRDDLPPEMAQSLAAAYHSFNCQKGRDHGIDS